MARIRSIKPEFWTSEQIVECSPITRLLFVGMWTFCDDGGVHPASSKRLKMEVFPGDDCTLKDIDACVDELIKNSLIIEFKSGSELFWEVTGWQHQKIDKPTFKFPRSFDESSTIIRRSFDESSPPESNGEESNGEEREGISGNYHLLPTKDIPDAHEEKSLDLSPGVPAALALPDLQSNGNGKLHGLRISSDHDENRETVLAKALREATRAAKFDKSHPSVVKATQELEDYRASQKGKVLK